MILDFNNVLANLINLNLNEVLAYLQIILDFNI